MRRRRFQPAAILAVLVAIAVFQLFNRQKPAPNVTPLPSAAQTSSDRDGARVSSPAPSAAHDSTGAGGDTRAPHAGGDTRAPHAGEDTRATRVGALDPAERTEVERTLALIARGGPFLHRQDGSVFSNRERRLPDKPRGYYREYTVETPGADTRGARRIVRGRDGETYYTNDHYGTFVKIE